MTPRVKTLSTFAAGLSILVFIWCILSGRTATDSKISPIQAQGQGTATVYAASRVFNDLSVCAVQSVNDTTEILASKSYAKL